MDEISSMVEPCPDMPNGSICQVCGSLGAASSIWITVTSDGVAEPQPFFGPAQLILCWICYECAHRTQYDSEFLAAVGEELIETAPARLAEAKVRREERSRT